MKNIHFLLRYSDTLSGADTIAEHQAVLSEYSAVWMGKFGIGMANRFAELAKQQIADGNKCSLYLMHGSKYTFKANIIDVVTGSDSIDKILTKSPKLTPSYYRKKPCSIWFKLNDISPIDMTELKNIWLYNDPASHPSARGMRGLIYLTYNDAPELNKKPNNREVNPLYTEGLFD
ncbi:hypothetical protein WMQ40_00185 [Vibrio diabolicus]|uniref:hypothetical protein n=1 Tax=Vibrio diabolicus TaxID=50719 RepID=UPI001DF676E7|nr:hypothetical protein [Vibrio parahaemolyticus]EJG1091310.1 hypothetical protein [Vibrio parahaemolyticus]EJG1727742.1 hypothetical protein [Vibrio parahaemolyticus]HCE1242914.1 hypothetical protein [Vibrio parahaemolyticus]HCG6226369.1 hypothetical protein [Vibrio parahaemolyticus]